MHSMRHCRWLVLVVSGMGPGPLYGVRRSAPIGLDSGTSNSPNTAVCLGYGCSYELICLGEIPSECKFFQGVRI